MKVIFALMIGATVGAVHVAYSEDETLRQIGEERSERMKADTARKIAEARELTARVELDTIRRRWMQDRETWWKIPAATDDDEERIPKPATPYPTR